MFRLCLRGFRDRPRENGHEFRKVYRPQPRFRAVGPVARAARGPSAICARAPAQSFARRPGRSGRGPDRPGRRQFARGAGCDRGGARQAAQDFGGGAGQVYLDPALGRVFDAAEKAGEKAGDSFVTVERLLLALALEKGTEAGKILSLAGVTPQTLNAAIEALRKGRTADSASAENAYDALKKYARDLTQAARDGKLDPVIGRDEEIRRTIQV